jgi:hypothetical protein
LSKLRKGEYNIFIIVNPNKFGLLAK